MTTQPHPELNDRTADWARPLYERQIAVLGVLAEAGLALALDIKDQANLEPAQVATAFGRAARAVRLSLMLQARLIKELEARDTHQAHLKSAGARDERYERQAQIERIVERVAADQCEDAGEVERLVQETCDRLDTDDLYGGLLDRPVSELIALICNDLGLDPDWPRLAEEAWAKEELATDAPGWPLASLTSGASLANLVQGRFRPSG